MNTQMVIFFILLKCISISCTNRPIIGILTQDFSGHKINESLPMDGTYIGAAYVKVVESSGARVVPIFINQPRHYYERLLYSINGVVIPGGNTEIEPGYPFYDAFTTIMEISEQMNKNGIHFPVLGICWGFEAMMTMYNHHKLLQTTCNAVCTHYTLKFAPKFTESLLFSDIDHLTYFKLKNLPISVHNHGWCTTERNFTKARSLSQQWKITSYSTTSQGLKFISSAEHKKYPFIAIQFHPEKVIFEWNEKLNIPHYPAAIQANRYFYDVFIKLSKLNNNKFKSEQEENEALIYKHKTIRPDPKLLPFAQIYIFK